MDGAARTSGDSLRRLVSAARVAARRAYAPYSGFRVGVALEDEEGILFAGANIENVAYPLGICAERTALLSWRARRGAPLRAVAVYTYTSVPTPPCGLCRDALLRWAPGAKVYLACRTGVTGPHQPSGWLPQGSLPGEHP